jgi:hypothetical protein
LRIPEHESLSEYLCPGNLMVVPGWPLVYDLSTEDSMSPATFWKDFRLPVIFTGNKGYFSAE